MNRVNVSWFRKWGTINWLFKYWVIGVEVQVESEVIKVYDGSPPLCKLIHRCKRLTVTLLCAGEDIYKEILNTKTCFSIFLTLIINLCFWFNGFKEQMTHSFILISISEIFSFPEDTSTDHSKYFSPYTLLIHLLCLAIHSEQEEKGMVSSDFLCYLTECCKLRF